MGGQGILLFIGNFTYSFKVLDFFVRYGRKASPVSTDPAKEYSFIYWFEMYQILWPHMSYNMIFESCIDFQFDFQLKGSQNFCVMILIVEERLQDTVDVSGFWSFIFVSVTMVSHYIAELWMSNICSHFNIGVQCHHFVVIWRQSYLWSTLCQ